MLIEKEQNKVHFGINDWRQMQIVLSIFHMAQALRYGIHTYSHMNVFIKFDEENLLMLPYIQIYPVD